MILTWWLTHPSAQLEARAEAAPACGLGLACRALELLYAAVLSGHTGVQLAAPRRQTVSRRAGLPSPCRRGRDSRAYRRVVQCFADHQCLPRAGPGETGSAPSWKRTQAHRARRWLSDLHGTWHELRAGCGRPDSDWQGGYDQLPCRSSLRVAREDETWYHAPRWNWVREDRCPASSLSRR